MADDKETVEKTIAEDLVVTKYKLAGEIVNRTLKTLLQSIEVGSSVRELCEKGDSLLLEETGKVYKKEKELKKGIAFPTCLSINNCVCHFSPTKNDPDVVIKDGDVVKIDLGAHIDGFIAVAAHTIVAGAKPDTKITGRKADVILAAYWAAQVALRLLKPGTDNYTITGIIQTIAEEYNCKPIEGMLSHQLKQNTIDGEKTIIQNPTEPQRKEHEKCEFELHDVYAIDVLISTGDGVGREKDTRVSIYKKTNENYQLKLKTARGFLKEIKNKNGNMPFNLRHCEEETKARMGVVECISHKMIEPFQVLYEKQNEFVAQFKYTVLLMPNGINLVTDMPFKIDQYESEYSVTDSVLKDLMTTDLKPPKNKKKDAKTIENSKKNDTPVKKGANKKSTTASPQSPPVTEAPASVPVPTAATTTTTTPTVTPNSTSDSKP